MINTYLTFPGNCEQAITFYAKVFQGKVEFSMKHGETPMKDQLGPEWQDKIVHSTVRIGDNVLMASDAPPQYYKTPQGFSVSVTLSLDEAERVFNALADGGTVNMPFAKTFWAERFGAVVDRFGTPWMITGGHETKA